MDDLTNEQKLLLTTMYRDYLELSKKVGSEKANAFGDSDEINYKYFIDRSNSYVSSLCWTLYRKGYIDCHGGDNKANEISITDDTIIYFENKFKNNTSKVLNAINELLNFVPLFK